jgi:hypothetical protein
VEANLIPQIRSIVNRFVATGSVEKGKSVGRPPVNEEIVEDLRQRMNKAQKNLSGSYNFRLMYHSPLVRKLLEKSEKT